MNYLKIIFIFFILFLPFFNCYAQFDYGFKTGLTIANQNWKYGDISTSDTYDNRYGFNFGIFVEYQYLDYLSFLSDIYYSQRGMVSNMEVTYVANNPNGYIDKKISWDNRLDFIGLLLSTKLKLKTKALIPYAIAGFKYEYLINKKIVDFYQTEYKNYKDNILGLIFGIGTEFTRLVSVPIIIEGIYHYDINSAKINESLKIKNHSIEVKLGVRL